MCSSSESMVPDQALVRRAALGEVCSQQHINSLVVSTSEQAAERWGQQKVGFVEAIRSRGLFPVKLSHAPTTSPLSAPFLATMKYFVQKTLLSVGSALPLEKAQRQPAQINPSFPRWIMPGILYKYGIHCLTILLSSVHVLQC